MHIETLFNLIQEFRDMSAQTKENETFIFLRRAKVKALTGLSASTIWRLEQKKDFRCEAGRNLLSGET